MPVAEIVRLNRLRMTSQQLADMALAEDREARRYAANGEAELAAEHDKESAALCRLIRESK